MPSKTPVFNIAISICAVPCMLAERLRTRAKIVKLTHEYLDAPLPGSGDPDA
jgi:hypothetical protein